MTSPPSIGVVGIGEPGYKSRNDNTLPELVHNAARTALADASLERNAIDNVIVCASDLEDGRAISTMTTIAPAGGYNKDFAKTTDSGIHALELAMLRMEAGQFESSLVLSWGKGTEANLEESARLEGEPFVHRDTGLNYPGGHAIEATPYYHEHPSPEDAAAWLVEHNTEKALSNPRVEDREVIKADDAKRSSVEAWPLREDYIPSKSDGASAIVLGTPRFISEYSPEPEPVWVRGVGRQTAPYNAGERTLGRLTALEQAGKRAYEEAALETPSTVDAVELHGKSVFHELMALEALDLVDETPTTSVLEREFGDGDISLNPSGGTLGANPLIGAGLARVAAAARYLRGDTQTKAIAHSTAGFTDQVHSVAVLEGGVDA